MMAELIDRIQLKADVKTLLADAQVSPKAMTALYMGLLLLTNLVDNLAGGGHAVTDRNLLGIFVYVMVALLNSILNAGFVLYCMAVRRGERAEFLTLFDGFSFTGKIIGLNIVQNFFIMLWSMLFIFPGIVAAYRYRFAMYNLCENPGISIMEALDMSKRQTAGYKWQLFLLDLSYLGWGIASGLPALALILWENARSAEAFLSGAPVVETAILLGSAVWLTALVCDLWDLVVSIFYLPNCQCVDLGYFETAKRTSGVGAGGQPRNDNPWTGDMGPDGLGGM